MFIITGVYNLWACKFRYSVPGQACYSITEVVYRCNMYMEGASLEVSRHSMAYATKLRGHDFDEQEQLQ
jgi:hypothetical protein